MPRVEIAAELTVSEIESIPNGLHVTLINKQFQVGLGLWLSMVNGELRAVLPAAEIREEFDELFRLFAVRLLPDLLLCNADEEMLLPAATGMLASPAGKPPLRDSFMIYGEQERIELAPALPLCAIGGSGGGLACLAVGGAAEMRCDVLTLGNGQGRVALTPTLRESWRDSVDLCSRELVFAPLRAGEDLLHAAARRLRRHIIEDLHKPPLAERAKESPEVAYMLSSYVCKLFFGIQRQGAMLGGRTRAALNEQLFQRTMTFAQAGEGLRRLKAAGLERLYTQNVGWNPRGHDGLWPSRFPIEDRLGGEAGFRRLITDGKALGYSMAVHDNWANAYAASPDFNLDRMVHGVDGLPRIVGFWGGGATYNHWGPALPEDEIRKTYQQIKDLGVNGMHYLDIGAPPMRNYQPAHSGSRSAFAQGLARTMCLAREVFGGCASKTGFLETVLASDLVDGPVSAGFQPGFKKPGLISQFLPGWPIADLKGRSVPLWLLALHGLVAVESHGEDWASVMNCVSLGLIPRNEWAMEPGVMPVLDDELIARMKAKYDLCVKTFGRLAELELIEWQQLSEKAVATRFADGTEVVADHATQTLRVNGKEVSSRQACPPGGATAGQIAG
jgi:hypothetical protein